MDPGSSDVIFSKGKDKPISGSAGRAHTWLGVLVTDYPGKLDTVIRRLSLFLGAKNNLPVVAFDHLENHALVIATPAGHIVGAWY